MNGVRMTDAELTEAYSQYSDMVYRIAVNQTRSTSQAEDIQQDVFMALVRYSDRIRSQEHLKAWLIRVTQNACHKHYRNWWIKYTVYFDDNLAKGEENEQDSPDPGGYPGAEDRDHPYDEMVREMVEELPENSRIVVHLFYYEEMSVREIAEVLDISEQNVKTRLSRARDKLRSKLEGEIR